MSRYPGRWTRVDLVQVARLRGRRFSDVVSGLLDVQAVLGLVESCRLLAVDHFVRYLPASVRGQAVHVDRVRIGLSHILGRGFPVLVAVEDLLRLTGV